MQTFATGRDAKEFLVSRIVTEAEREGVPLSEVERKMLYFSETAWTLEDITEVNGTFDREYDQTEYEQKIAKLAANFCATAHSDNRDEFNAWREAANTLRREDHYLSVLISAAGASCRPRGDYLKLLAAAVTIVGIMIAFALLVTRS